MPLLLILAQLTIHLYQLAQPWDYSDDTPHPAPYQRVNWTFHTEFMSEISDYSKRWVPQNPPKPLHAGSPVIDLPSDAMRRLLYEPSQGDAVFKINVTSACRRVKIRVDSYYRADDMISNKTFAAIMFTVSTQAARPSMYDMGWQPRNLIQHHGVNGTMPQTTAVLALEPDGAGVHNPGLYYVRIYCVTMKGVQRTNSTCSMSQLYEIRYWEEEIPFAQNLQYSMMSAPNQAGKVVVRAGVDSPLNSADFTMSYWVRNKGCDLTQAEGCMHMSSEYKAFEQGVAVESYNLYVYPCGSGASKLNKDTKVKLPQDTWVHLSWTYSSSRLKLFVNGYWAFECAAGIIRRGDIYFGNMFDEAENPGASKAALNGNLDEIRIWPRALSAAEVALKWNMYAAYVHELVGYWRMNESRRVWQGSGTQVWDLTGAGNHGQLLYYPNGYNFWDASQLPPLLAETSTALLETFKVTSSQFNTISWFAICVENPERLLNITADSISGAHATILATKIRGPDQITDSWTEPMWRADETLLTGHDSNRTSSVFLSKAIDSDFGRGMLYIGVYVDSELYSGFDNSLINVQSWSIDPALTCPNDCNGKGYCRNGQCVCYETKCQGGWCHLDDSRNCAFGCDNSCDGTTFCYPGGHASAAVVAAQKNGTCECLQGARMPIRSSSTMLNSTIGHHLTNCSALGDGPCARKIWSGNVWTGCQSGCAPDCTGISGCSQGTCTCYDDPLLAYSCTPSATQKAVNCSGRGVMQASALVCNCFPGYTGQWCESTYSPELPTEFRVQSKTQMVQNAAPVIGGNRDLRGYIYYSYTHLDRCQGFRVQQVVLEEYNNNTYQWERTTPSNSDIVPVRIAVSRQQQQPNMRSYTWLSSGIPGYVKVDVPYTAKAFSPGIFTIAVWCPQGLYAGVQGECPVDFAIKVTPLQYFPGIDPIGKQLPFSLPLLAPEDTGDIVWQSVCITDIAHGITLTTTEVVRTVIVKSQKLLPPSQRTEPFETIVQWTDFAMYSQPSMSNFLSFTQPFSGTAAAEQPTTPAVNTHFCMGYAAIEPGIYHIGFFVDVKVQSHRRRLSPPGTSFSLKLSQSIDHCSQTHVSSIAYSSNSQLSLSTDTTDTPVDPKQPISPSFFSIPIQPRSRILQIELFTSEGNADAYLGTGITPPTPYGQQRYFPATQFQRALSVPSATGQAAPTAAGITSYLMKLTRGSLGLATQSVSASVFANSPDLKLSLQTRNLNYDASMVQYKRFLYSPINGTTPWEYGPCPTDNCAILGITSEFFCKLSPYYYKPEFYSWNNPSTLCPPDNRTCTVPFDRTFQYEMFAAEGEGLEIRVKVPQRGRVDLFLLKAGHGQQVELSNVTSLAEHPAWRHFGIVHTGSMTEQTWWTHKYDPRTTIGFGPGVYYALLQHHCPVSVCNDTCLTYYFTSNVYNATDPATAPAAPTESVSNATAARLDSQTSVQAALAHGQKMYFEVQLESACDVLKVQIESGSSPALDVYMSHVEKHPSPSSFSWYMNTNSTSTPADDAAWFDSGSPWRFARDSLVLNMDDDVEYPLSVWIGLYCSSGPLDWSRVNSTYLSDRTNVPDVRAYLRRHQCNFTLTTSLQDRPPTQLTQTKALGAAGIDWHRVCVNDLQSGVEFTVANNTPGWHGVLYVYRLPWSFEDKTSMSWKSSSFWLADRSVTRESLKLCAHTPNFKKGIYVIGVASECLVADCSGLTQQYTLLATPLNVACTLPLYNNVPVSGYSTQSSDNLYTVELSTGCESMIIEVASVIGNPDLYISNIEPSTSVTDWNWFSRAAPTGAFGAVSALGSEGFTLSSDNPEYTGKSYTFNIFCKGPLNCPAQYVLRVRKTTPQLALNVDRLSNDGRNFTWDYLCIPASLPQVEIRSYSLYGMYAPRLVMSFQKGTPTEYASHDRYWRSTSSGSITANDYSWVSSNFSGTWNKTSSMAIHYAATPELLQADGISRSTTQRSGIQHVGVAYKCPDANTCGHKHYSWVYRLETHSYDRAYSYTAPIDFNAVPVDATKVTYELVDDSMFLGYINTSQVAHQTQQLKFRIERTCAELHLLVTPVTRNGRLASELEVIVSRVAPAPRITDRSWSMLVTEAATLIIDPEQEGFSAGMFYITVSCVRGNTCASAFEVTARSVTIAGGGIAGWNINNAMTRWHRLCFDSYLPPGMNGLPLTSQRMGYQGLLLNATWNMTNMPQDPEDIPHIAVLRAPYQSSVRANGASLYATRLDQISGKTIKSIEQFYSADQLSYGYSSMLQNYMAYTPLCESSVGAMPEGVYYVAIESPATAQQRQYILGTGNSETVCAIPLSSDIVTTGVVRERAIMRYTVNLTSPCDTLTLKLQSYVGEAELIATDVDTILVRKSISRASLKPGIDELQISAPLDGPHANVVWSPRVIHVGVTCLKGMDCPARYTLSVTTTTTATSIAEYRVYQPALMSEVFPVCVQTGSTSSVKANIHTMSKLQCSAFALLPQTEPSAASTSQCLPSALGWTTEEVCTSETSCLWGEPPSMCRSGCERELEMNTSVVKPGIYNLELMNPCPVGSTDCLPTSMRYYNATVGAHTAGMSSTRSHLTSMLQVLRSGKTYNSDVSATTRYRQQQFSITPRHVCDDLSFVLSATHKVRVLVTYTGRQYSTPTRISKQFWYNGTNHTDSVFGWHFTKTSVNFDLLHASKEYQQHKTLFITVQYWNAATSFSITGALTDRTNTQLFTGDESLAPGQVRWYAICLQSFQFGLNVTASVGVGSTRAHFVVTRHQRSGAPSAWGAMSDAYSDGESWRDSSFEDGLFGQLDETVTTLQLCKSTPGTGAGAYLIGVFKYCMGYVPHFVNELSPPASLHLKHNCSIPSNFVLYATPFQTPCIEPLSNGLLTSGQLQDGDSSPILYQFDLPSWCTDLLLELRPIANMSTDPDLYFSNRDWLPTIHGFTWQSTVPGADIYMLSRESLDFSNGRYGISISCNSEKVYTLPTVLHTRNKQQEALCVQAAGSAEQAALCTQKVYDTGNRQRCAGVKFLLRAQAISRSNSIRRDGSYTHGDKTLRWYPLCIDQLNASFPMMSLSTSPTQLIPRSSPLAHYSGQATLRHFKVVATKQKPASGVVSPTGWKAPSWRSVATSDNSVQLAKATERVNSDIGSIALLPIRQQDVGMGMVYVGIYYDCWDLGVTSEQCNAAYKDTGYELSLSLEPCRGGCSSHGFCISDNSCRCLVGYSGTDCSVFTSANAPNGSLTKCAAAANMIPQHTPLGLMPVVDTTSSSCVCADGCERLACYEHFRPTNYTIQLRHNVTFSGRLLMSRLQHFHYVHASVCASFVIYANSSDSAAAFDILASTKAPRPTDSSQTLYSWGANSLTVSHRDSYFTNGTYHLTVRCRRGYHCDHVNVTIVETAVTRQTVGFTWEMVGTQNEYLWNEVCIVDGSRGMNLTSVIQSPQWSMLESTVPQPTNPGTGHSIILKSNVPAGFGMPDQMSMPSWRTLGWYDQALFGAKRDERHLCASSEGLKPGVYNVGLMWQCTPEYSWRVGNLDHLFCEAHRHDCWSGAWENQYLLGCVPDDSMLGEFVEWFATLQDAKDWCLAAGPACAGVTRIGKYLEDCNQAFCGYQPRAGIMVNGKLLIPSDPYGHGSGDRCGKATLLDFNEESWIKRDCALMTLEVAPRQDTCSIPVPQPCPTCTQLSFSGKVTQNAHAFYKVRIPNPCVEFKVQLHPVSGDPGLLASNAQNVPHVVDFNWFNNSLGGEQLSVSPQDPTYTSGEYLITVLCDAGTCSTKYIIEVTLSEAPSHFTLESELFDVDVDHTGLRQHHSTNGLNWTAVDWLPICLKDPMPSLELTANFGSSGDRVIMLMLSKTLGLHKTIGATDGRNATTFPAFSNTSFGTRQAALHISNQSAGLRPGAAYIGIFAIDGRTDLDLFKLHAVTNDAYVAAPALQPGIAITLYPDEAVQSTLNSTQYLYDYYSFEVTNPCTDILLSIDYTLTAPAGRSLELVVSRHEAHPSQQSFSWTSLLGSAAVVSSHTANRVSKVITVPHSDELFGTGTYSVGVFCANCSRAWHSIKYNISVQLHLQDGGNLEALSQVQHGKIVWFSTCIANLSRTFLVSTSSHTTTPAQIVLRRSPVVPIEEQHPWRGPSWRMSVATNTTSNMKLQATGTSFTLQGSVQTKFVLTQDLIGFEPGPLYIGVYTTCLISRPYFVPNPQPWPNYNSYSRCDAGTVFDLQGWMLPTGRTILLQNGQVVSGITHTHQAAQFEFVLSGICSELDIYLESVSGDADVYASNVDHMTSWTSNSWSSRKTGNDHIKISRTGNDFSGDTIRIAVTCESSKVCTEVGWRCQACPATFVLRVEESKLSTHLNFESYLFATSCDMSCEMPTSLNTSLSPPPSTCCSPKDVYWFDVCFERNMPLLIAVHDVSVNSTCNLPSVALRRKGQMRAHLHSAAPFTATGCAAEYSFVATQSFSESLATCNSYFSSCAWSPIEYCTNCTKWNVPISDTTGQSLSTCKQSCENTIRCGFINFLQASVGRCLLFAACSNATTSHPSSCTAQTEMLSIRLHRTGTSAPAPSSSAVPAGYYEVGLHYPCTEGPCNTLQPSAYRVTTSSIAAYPPSPPAADLTNLTAISNGSCISAQLDQVVVFNVTDICTSFRVNVTCGTGAYTLRIAAGQNPRDRLGSFEWSDTSVKKNKTLYIDSFDENYREGFLFVWVAPRSGAPSSSCEIAATTVKQHDQLVVLNEQSTQDGISWHSVCITDVRRGLNVTVVGKGSIQPHFVVTREMRAKQCSNANELNVSAWTSNNFWYPVVQDYCFKYDQFDTCTQITRSADYLVLCSNTPGFVRGGYLIGVFTYCMLATPFFAPAPQRPSYTSNGLDKNRCENATEFNLYVSPSENNCSTALIDNAAQSVVVGYREYANFHVDLTTICDGVTVELVQHQGRPDLYSSAVDANPGMHGYSLQSRTNRNAFITTDPSKPAHQAGRHYFSVFCEKPDLCPALLTLRTRRSIWNTVVDQNTYTTTAAELRRLPAVCVPEGTSLKMSLENIKQAANHFVLAPFVLPLSNLDRYEGPTLRSSTEGFAHLEGYEPVRYYTKGLEVELEPFYSKGGPGYNWAKGTYKDDRGSYNNGWSALDAGLYHAAVFTQRSSHLSLQMLRDVPIRIPDSAGSKFDVTFEAVPFTSGPAPPLGFRIYDVLIEIERGLPCPAHSTQDVYDVWRPELVDGVLSTFKKRCRCGVATAPGDPSYMAMKPEDDGYDPDYPRCVVADVDRVRPCDRGWTCGGRWICGPITWEGAMCQELPQIEVNAHPTLFDSPPAVLQAVQEGDPWFYFQHETVDPCIDLVFQANVTSGRIRLLVSNTPDLRPTESNWTWSSSTADGIFAYQPHTVQVTIKHTDSRYKAGLWFAAVQCLSCPSYSTWSVYHNKPTPKVPTATSHHCSAAGIQVLNVSGSVTGSQMRWYQACVSDTTTGMQLETLVAPSLSSAGIRASFLAMQHSDDVTRRTVQDIQLPGSPYEAPGWNVPVWQSPDFVFNLTGSSTWGHDDTVCTSNTSNMLKLCPSTAGFKPGPLWIAVFVDCRLLNCAALTVPFTLLVKPPTESLRLFYQLGLHTELSNYCAHDGNIAVDTEVEQFRAGTKCAITLAVFNRTLAIYGAQDEAQIWKAFVAFDLNRNNFIEYSELENAHQRLTAPDLAHVSAVSGSFDELRFDAPCTIALASNSRPLSGVLTSNQRVQYSVLVKPCEKLTVAVTAFVGDPDLYISNADRAAGDEGLTWHSWKVGSDTLVLLPSDPATSPGRYYIEVKCAKETSCPARYSIAATTESISSPTSWRETRQLRSGTMTDWVPLCYDKDVDFKVEIESSTELQWVASPDNTTSSATGALRLLQQNTHRGEMLYLGVRRTEASLLNPVQYSIVVNATPAAAVTPVGGRRSTTPPAGAALSGCVQFKPYANESDWAAHQCVQRSVWIPSPCSSLAVQLSRTTPSPSASVRRSNRQWQEQPLRNRRETLALPTLSVMPEVGSNYHWTQSAGTTVEMPWSSLRCGAVTQSADTQSVYVPSGTDGMPSKPSSVVVQLCCNDQAGCTDQWQVDAERLDASPAMPHLVSSTVEIADIKWFSVCLPEVQQGLKLRTFSQIIGRPAAGFLVSQYSQRPAEALASESSSSPTFKSSRLMGGTTTTGEQSMSLCAHPGLRAGPVHIGVMTRCVQYTPYFKFARDPSNVKVTCDIGMDFYLEIETVPPLCTDNCASPMPFPTLSAVAHGNCTGCRGRCGCHSDWGGPTCAIAECQNDNCFGHGKCNGRICECEEGYYSERCDKIREDTCPHNCYGNGECDTLTSQYSNNVTVASCECTGSAIGYLCGYIAATYKLDKTTAISQWVILSLCATLVIAALVATFYTRLKLNEYNYSQVEHVNATDWNEIQTNKLEGDKGDDDSDEQREESMHAEFIALDEQSESIESLEENSERENNPLITIPMKHLDL